MERVLKRVKIKTPESRPEMIMPSSKQGVKSKFLRRETVCQPSLSLQIAILVDKSRIEYSLNNCDRRAFIPSLPWIHDTCQDWIIDSFHESLSSNLTENASRCSMTKNGLCPTRGLAHPISIVILTRFTELKGKGRKRRRPISKHGKNAFFAFYCWKQSRVS